MNKKATNLYTFETGSFTHQFDLHMRKLRYKINAKNLSIRKSQYITHG